MNKGERLEARVRHLNPPRSPGEGLYVAYWMVASRRTFWNPALERAARWARHLGQSLLVCEPLRRSGEGGQYRSHRFLLDGMVSNARRLAYAGVPYHAFVESDDVPETGLLEAVARRASVWITDYHSSTDLGDYSHLTRGAGLPIRAEAVDGESVIGATAAGSESAPDLEAFRSCFRTALLESLQSFPSRNPLAKFFETQLQTVLPHIAGPWPGADGVLLSGDPERLSALALSAPPPFPEARGGSDAAFESWRGLIGDLSGADSDGTPKHRGAPRSKHSGPPTTGSVEPETRSTEVVASRAVGTGGADASGSSAASLSGGRALPQLLADAGAHPDRQTLLAYHLAAGHLSSFQVLAESLRHCRWTPSKLAVTPGAGEDWWGLPSAIAKLLDTFVVQREWELTKLPAGDLRANLAADSWIVSPPDGPSW